MDVSQRATQIRLWEWNTPQMRAFHMSWLAFFLCFFAWFGIAPLMTVVREEMSLSREQLGWCIIGSVAITAFSRVLIGLLCDRIGPRLTYSGLLMVGSLPVMGIGLAYDYESFLLFRIAIGVIGAAFVITQCHTSLMFAPNCVGTANATTAGWGNLGGGVTQLAMPALFALLVGTFGFSDGFGWRAAMLLAGAICFLMGGAYYFLTQDTPTGNFAEMRAAGKLPEKKTAQGEFWKVCQDYRVWVLFVIYGACFGIELTIHNIAALYFVDYFEEFRAMTPTQAMGIAGLIASLFGLMNLFARTLGGSFADRFGKRWGLAGRVKWLFLVLFCEGLALILFSQVNLLAWAIPALILFSLFVQMSEGATYSVVPFLHSRAIGSVSGIVGSGGNAGAVAAGFLFKSSVIAWPTALFMLGALVTCCSFLAFAIHVGDVTESEAPRAVEIAIEDRRRMSELLGANA